MNPTVRMLRLLALFQQRPDWTGHDLARELDVTPRTVRRDIARMRDLGYAVDASPGSEGGYRLRAGSVLPPLVLTDGEAVVLAVGLRAAALSGVAGSSDVAVSAVAKLEGLLPHHVRERVDAVAQDVASLTDPGTGRTDPAVLAALALACRRREYVALSYTDARGQSSRRDVAPLRVVHAQRRWYLVAHDARRDAWRTFRIDRVTSAEPLGGRVSFTDAPDPVALVAESITTSVYRWTAHVRLHLPYRYAVNRVPPTIAQLTEEPDGTTLLRTGADDLQWLARYLVGLICDLEVLDPPELVDALQDVGRRLATTGPTMRLRE